MNELPLAQRLLLIISDLSPARRQFLTIRTTGFLCVAMGGGDAWRNFIFKHSNAILKQQQRTSVGNPDTLQLSRTFDVFDRR